MFCLLTVLSTVRSGGFKLACRIEVHLCDWQERERAHTHTHTWPVVGVCHCYHTCSAETVGPWLTSVVVFTRCSVCWHTHTDCDTHTQTHTCIHSTHTHVHTPWHTYTARTHHWDRKVSRVHTHTDTLTHTCTVYTELSDRAQSKVRPTHADGANASGLYYAWNSGHSSNMPLLSWL